MKKIFFITLLFLLILTSCTHETNRLAFRRYVYESFVTDSIVLQLGELAGNTAEDGEPVSYVGYDLEFPVKAINAEVLRRLQLNVLSVIHEGVDVSSSDPRAEMDRVFAGMKLAESDTCPVDPLSYSDYGKNITTHDFTVVRTITNADSLYTLCLSSDYYAFGAAHGLYAIRYYSFSTLTGNMLTFDSLFVAGADTTFCNFMTRQIPVDYKESYNTDFTFQGDPQVSNGSFYFTPDGIIFSFSPYAIGSFADGQIDCLIPSSIAKPLLQKNWAHLLR